MKVITKTWLNMKRIFYFISILAVLFTACNKNELPKFDDSDAFVKFDVTSASFDEDKDTVTIPVSLASIGGVTATVSYTVADGAAVLDSNYKLVDPNATLSFDANHRVRNIEIVIVNKSGLYTGDLDFSITLTNSSVAIGAQKTCKVTINDLDHPLTPILGAYTANGDSYFDGASQWDIVIKKDASDVHKVWFENLVKDGTNQDVFGIVDDEMSEIQIPVKQVIFISSTYPLILLEGFYGPDGETKIPQGGHITVTIAGDKKSMTIMDEFGSEVYSDAAGTSSLGWYNIFKAGTVLTKK